MSARRIHPHHPDSAHASVVEAIRRLVYQIGLKETARMLGMSESQMPRRLAKGHISAWSHGDVLALKKRERDEFGARTLHEAEERALYGTEQGEAIAAAEHVTRNMGIHGEIVSLEARILIDGINERDRADIETLGSRMGQAHSADRMALASLKQRLGAAPVRRGRA